MNCQEYKSMIEDALDVSLRGELKTSVLRHLEHCPECRAYYAWRKREHSQLFSRVNAAYAHSRPPPADFADRVVREVAARRAARRGWWRFSLPRWALVAAVLAVVAGFVFAAVEVIEAATARADASEASSAESSGRAVADGVGETALPSTSQLASSTYQPSNNQGESTMTKKKAATAALTAAMVAAPLSATRGGEYQYIVSGDPVAAETADSSSASSATSSLTSGTCANGFVCASAVEARAWTTDESAVTALRSDKFNGTFIIFK